MRICYVARSFLDYRLPVLAELDQLCGGRLHFITSDKWSPPRVLNRLRSLLGDRAISLAGEKSLGVSGPLEANTSVCLPWQPGLMKAIATTKPDVLVGDGFLKWTGAALLYRVRHGTPLVVLYERTAHTERNAQWYRLSYRKFALNFTDAMSCNGRLCMEYTVSLGFPRERITLGHMAADTESMELGAKSGEAKTESRKLRADWLGNGGPPVDATDDGSQSAAVDDYENRESAIRRRGFEGGLVFLYVGQLIKRKGIAELLEGWAVFAQSAERRTQRMALVLVGSGPEEQNLRRQMSDLDLQNVLFLGSVDYDRLAPYYVAADAFIIPTLEDNWSLVVPEAMACGLPILCSKYNGCWPELVQEGRNGWVFDPIDPQDIAHCLALASGERAADVGRGSTGHGPRAMDLCAMGAQSREILQHHTPRKAAQAIYRACEIALNRRRRR